MLHTSFVLIFGYLAQSVSSSILMTTVMFGSEEITTSLQLSVLYFLLNV
jgi:hypothetical protein